MKFHKCIEFSLACTVKESKGIQIFQERGSNLSGYKINTKAVSLCIYFLVSVTHFQGRRVRSLQHFRTITLQVSLGKERKD